MNMNMNNSRGLGMAVIFSLLLLGLLHPHKAWANQASLAAILRDIEQTQDLPKKGDALDLLSLRQAGEFYYGTTSVTIAGDASKQSLFNMFGVNAKHVTFNASCEFVEEIKSVSPDKIEGRIAIIRSSALMGPSDTSINVGWFDSRTLVKNHGKKILERLKNAASVATAGLIYTHVGLPLDAVLPGVGSSATILASKKADTFYDDLKKNAQSKIQSDGSIIVEAVALEGILPKEVKMARASIGTLAGMELKYVWTMNKGYEFTVMESGRRVEGDEELVKNLLNGILRRASWLSINEVLPEQYRKDPAGSLKKGWDIPAESLVSSSAMAGIKYDKVNGMIRVALTSNEKTLLQHEVSNTKFNDVNVSTLTIQKQGTPPIELLRTGQGGSHVAFKFRPEGNVKIVNDSRVGSYYPTEINLSADILNISTQDSHSWWKKVSWQGQGTITISSSFIRYQQKQP